MQLLTVDGRPAVAAAAGRRSSSRSPRPSPACKGDTVSNVTKPATLETGAIVQVPLFVNEGDRIKVDTRDGRYLSRAWRMTRLVDTTIRLLSQDPLAGHLSTARLLRARRALDARGLRRARGLGRRLLRERRQAGPSRARGSASARSRPGRRTRRW